MQQHGHCRRLPSQTQNPKKCTHPEVPASASTEPLWQPPPPVQAQSPGPPLPGLLFLCCTLRFAADLPPHDPRRRAVFGGHPPEPVQPPPALPAPPLMAARIAPGAHGATLRPGGPADAADHRAGPERPPQRHGHPSDALHATNGAADRAGHDGRALRPHAHGPGGAAGPHGACDAACPAADLHLRGRPADQSALRPHRGLGTVAGAAAAAHCAAAGGPGGRPAAAPRGAFPALLDSDGGSVPHQPFDNTAPATDGCGEPDAQPLEDGDHRFRGLTASNAARVADCTGRCGCACVWGQQGEGLRSREGVARRGAAVQVWGTPAAIHCEGFGAAHPIFTAFAPPLEATTANGPSECGFCSLHQQRFAHERGHVPEGGCSGLASKCKIALIVMKWALGDGPRVCLTSENTLRPHIPPHRAGGPAGAVLMPRGRWGWFPVKWSKRRTWCACGAGPPPPLPPKGWNAQSISLWFAVRDVVVHCRRVRQETETQPTIMSNPTDSACPHFPHQCPWSSHHVWSTVPQVDGNLQQMCQFHTEPFPKHFLHQ